MWDVHEVEMLCDKIMIIQNGKIINTCKVKSIKGTGISLEDYFVEKINEEGIINECNTNQHQN
jgi:ABC-2 type transport system ATP-binding protein